MASPVKDTSIQNWRAASTRDSGSSEPAERTCPCANNSFSWPSCANTYKCAPMASAHSALAAAHSTATRRRSAGALQCPSKMTDHEQRAEPRSAEHDGRPIAANGVRDGAQRERGEALAVALAVARVAPDGQRDAEITGTSSELKSEKLSAMGSAAKLSAATAPAMGLHRARARKVQRGYGEHALQQLRVAGTPKRGGRTAS